MPAAVVSVSFFFLAIDYLSLLNFSFEIARAPESLKFSWLPFSESVVEMS
jgi:hypothetical protein